jgi:hypothetical protein
MVKNRPIRHALRGFREEFSFFNQKTRSSSKRTHYLEIEAVFLAFGEFFGGGCFEKVASLGHSF